MRAGKSGIKLILFYVFAGLAGSAPAFAYTVSFIVIETGLVPDGPKTAASVLWEDGLMDVFFNAGHIVSNARTLRIDREPPKDFPDEVSGDFDEAGDGGMDFFVMVLLDYQSGGEISHGAAVKPREVLLRVFRVVPYQKVYEKRYSNLTGDESVRAKNAARAIFPHLRDI
ncbi:MAG: hypothetical protein LBU18_06125 [Treponema sp.]|nr:hypothetical protein [Treponema sp.]